MNQTQKGVLVAILVALLGGVAYVALKPKPATPPAPVQETAAKTQEPAKPASSMTDLGGLLDKTSRLMADAGTATAALKGLYQGGKAPEAAALTDAKARVETALTAVTGIELPAGAEGAPADMVKKAQANAAKGLEILRTLPADAAGALAALAELEAAITGKPVEAPATPAAAPAPAPAAPAAPAAPSTAAATPAAPAEAPAAPATAAAPAAPADGSGTEVATTGPAFDLLRVEPDGSTVIAGRASEGDKVEILDGDKVVSSTEASDGGDFAAVFEQPLTPGDHQLTIRATGKDGKAITSQEVATVSVPKDQAGDLLAMVSKPGEASRVITAPGDRPGAPAKAETAAAAPAATTTEPAAPAAPAATVKAALQISAVELEGDRIFVAGTADPKSRVAAYADDKKIGETATGPDGHFVIDGVVPLTVGQHKIRVDQQDADGKVAFRAEVPFDRPAGEQVAAVAAPQTAGTAPVSATTASVSADFDAARTQVAKAFSLLKGLFADGKTPSVEQYAAARSANQIALQSLADFALPAGADQAAKDAVAKAHDVATKALALVKALPADPATARDKLAAIEAVLQDLIASASAAPAAPAPADATAAAPAPAAAPAAGSGEPAQVEQAPLTGTNSSVIIRKGDTLWQISRRVYGRGVRYTTIYLANKGKINNPDRILPGQVFGVPDKALPNSEELHWDRMHGKKIDG